MLGCLRDPNWSQFVTSSFFSACALKWKNNLDFSSISMTIPVTLGPWKANQSMLISGTSCPTPGFTLIFPYFIRCPAR